MGLRATRTFKISTSATDSSQTVLISFCFWNTRCNVFLENLHFKVTLNLFPIPTMNSYGKGCSRVGLHLVKTCMWGGWMYETSKLPRYLWAICFENTFNGQKVHIIGAVISAFFQMKHAKARMWSKVKDMTDANKKCSDRCFKLQSHSHRWHINVWWSYWSEKLKCWYVLALTK